MIGVLLCWLVAAGAPIEEVRKLTGAIDALQIDQTAALAQLKLVDCTNTPLQQSQTLEDGLSTLYQPGLIAAIYHVLANTLKQPNLTKEAMEGFENSFNTPSALVQIKQDFCQFARYMLDQKMALQAVVT